MLKVYNLDNARLKSTVCSYDVQFTVTYFDLNTIMNYGGGVYAVY